MTQVSHAAIAALLALPFVVAGPGAGRAQDLTVPAALDGTWVMTKDQDDGWRRAMRVSGSSVVILWQNAGEVIYGQGTWAAAPIRDGRIGVVMRGVTTIIPGLEDYEEQVSQMEFILSGPDSGEMWVPEVRARWGTLARSGCTLDMQYRERVETPPDGCYWMELRGVGFSGLEGECVFDQEWGDDWKRVTHGADGRLTPAACLINAPDAFLQ